MRNGAAAGRTRRTAFPPPPTITTQLAHRVVGQSNALDAIVPYVQVYQAGLAPEGRPAGVFLLLGPTGTGKTRTAEALAEVLHGSAKNLLKIDCGEFQMEHEVAKLIGAPPGYLGHRETQPMLTQQKLNAVASEKSSLSLVLFDEVEKAAPSLTRLLLGILDKATLRLGDNTSVNFERSLIFLTSNLGSRSMMKEVQPDFGFEAGIPKARVDVGRKLASIGLAAARRRFSPEFINRIDRILTYRPLDDHSLAEILDQHIAEFQQHVGTRLGPRAVEIEVPPETRRAILRKGTSVEFGARELKRTLHRHLTEPLAALVAGGAIEPGSSVRLVFSEQEDRLVLRPDSGEASEDDGY
ncbi:MAG TPA: AAA family ATPase [Bryobacteraceae bacterium]|nr:AAA family ATPase [Bryobacteraceae bacterium]